MLPVIWGLFGIETRNTDITASNSVNPLGPGGVRLRVSQGKEVDLIHFP